MDNIKDDNDFSSKGKRKGYLIDRKLQFKYMKLVLIGVLTSSVITAVIVGGGIYYLVKKTIAFRLPDVMEQKLTSEIIFSDVNHFVLVWLPIAILALGVIFAVISVIMSHRFVGPIYHLRDWLKSISNYDFSGHVTFRKKDALKSLEPQIEEVNRTLCAVIEKDRSIIEAIASKAEAIAGSTNNKEAEELVKATNELKDNMKRYKIKK